MTRRDEIHTVWASLPHLECKGLCQESCGPIEASIVERAMLARAGVELPDPFETLGDLVSGSGDATCPALVDGRCSAYEVRPLVCRLWGLVEEMPCPFGCVPEGGLLSSAEGRAIHERVLEIGGRPAWMLH